MVASEMLILSGMAAEGRLGRVVVRTLLPG